MKKLSIAIIAVTLIMIVVSILMFFETNSYSSALGKKTSISFKETKLDLKQVKPKTEKEVEFEFSNTGAEPLIIYSVDASCDCTTAKNPKRPIKPGKKSGIKIVYKGENTGKFYKSIRVFGNFEGSPQMLIIKGECK